MNMYRLNTLIILTVLCLNGCGLAGGTSSVKVNVDDRILTGKLANKVELSYFDIAQEAQINSTMDSQVSKNSIFNTIFSSSDKKAFIKSVEQSLNQVTWPNKKTLKLEILLRGHQVASGSLYISALGIWYWQITNENNEILYQEQFYASDSNVDQIWQTVGAIKENVNWYAVNRILHTAILIASSDTEGDIPMFDHTYSTLEQATENLPSSYAVFAAPIYTYKGIPILTDGGRTIYVDWDSVENKTKTDKQ